MIELNFAEKVSILGVWYAIDIVEQDFGFKGHPAAGGFTDLQQKRIVLRDKRDWECYKEDPNGSAILRTKMKKTLRHEIVHAFLYESGLSGNSRISAVEGWARNEEMVDWIALQGPKIIQAWEESGAL